jgi:hypothetical protein
MARENITEAALAAGEKLKSALKEGGVGEPGEPARQTAGERKNPPVGARDASYAEPGRDQLRSDPKVQGEESSEAKAAKAILDAQQTAVDDIRAGRPAPYYFTPPQSTVPPLDTAPSSTTDPHIEKK